MSYAQVEVVALPDQHPRAEIEAGVIVIDTDPFTSVQIGQPS